METKKTEVKVTLTGLKENNLNHMNEDQFKKAMEGHAMQMKEHQIICKILNKTKQEN